MLKSSPSTLIARTFRIWVSLIGAIFLWATPSCANSLVFAKLPEPKILHLQQQAPKSVESFITTLAQADVVYLAEQHDRAEDHQAQLEILQRLHAKQPNLVVAMEMFQRPYQTALNRYLDSTLTETELLAQSEYEKRWGYPWEFYAPILRFAQRHNLPVVALNVPTEVTQKVARMGLAGLASEDYQWIAPLDSIQLGPASYRQRIRSIYDKMHQGHGNSTGFDNFFLTQVLWDETMAANIADTLRQSPQATVVVLAGQGHLFYRDGISLRVARRRQQSPHSRSLKQIIIGLNPDPALGQKPEIADYFWYSPVGAEGNK